MDTLSLRPLAVTEIIDAAIKLLRRHARTLFTISAIVLIPLAVVQAIVGASVDDLVPVLDSETIQPEQALEALGGLMLRLLPLVIFSVAATGIVQLGSIKAISDVYLDRPTDWRSSLAHGLRRLPVAIGALLLAFIPVLLGLILCILPGIWLFTCWSLSSAAIAVENRGPAGSLGRSFSLVMKRFWPVLGVLALAYLVQFVLSAVAGGAAADLTLTGSSTSYLLATALDTVVAILATPFNAAVLAVTYFDLRVRLEGFDLERLAATMGAEPPTAMIQGGEQPPAPEPQPDRPDDPFGLGTPGP